MYEGIPIIGIAGGVGSGKSHVARLFGELGCLVIDSDAQAAEAYARPEVLAAIRQWWGDAAFAPDGRVDRRAIARRVFASAEERRRLEQLIHPVVAALRDERMARAARLVPPARPVAIVWDTPLLFEAGLAGRCDAVVFVDTPLEVRARRVRQTRGWDEGELTRRENSQWPLDRKRALSHHVMTNAAQPAGPARDSESPVQAADVTPADPESLRTQVRLTLSRILAATNGTHRDGGLDLG